MDETKLGLHKDISERFFCEAPKDNYMWHFTMPSVELIYNPKAEFADSLGVPL